MNKKLCWPAIHGCEKAGYPLDALSEILKLAHMMPDCSHLFALEIDRLLRLHSNSINNVTYSANGLSPASIKKQLSIDVTTAFKRLKPSVLSDDAISNTFNQHRAKVPADQLRYAFENAKGKEIDTLNILYANQERKNEDLWLYFLNKYLSQFELDYVTLIKGDRARYFRLLAEKREVIKEGSLVSVLMPAHNAEKTIEHACTSVLNQTWQALELIIVDDASTDQTWSICQSIAKIDSRVKLHRNSVNVGPYVSKNVAQQLATGQYLTSQNADDWAFPDRIQHQISLLLQDSRQFKVTTGTTLRIAEDGMFVRLSSTDETTDDGILRSCFSSMFIETKFFRQKIGAWDSVRVDADAEMVARLQILAPNNFIRDRRPTMLCREKSKNLIKSFFVEIAEKNENLPARLAYRQSWNNWHAAGKNLKIDFPIIKRRFDVSSELSIDRILIRKLLEDFETDYHQGLVWLGISIKAINDPTLTIKIAQKLFSVFSDPSWSKNRPELYSIAYALSRVYWAEGDYEKAFNLIDQSIDAAPHDFISIRESLHWRLRVARSELNSSGIRKDHLDYVEENHKKRLKIDSRFSLTVAESWTALGNVTKAKNHLKPWLTTEPELNFAMANCNQLDDKKWLAAVNAYLTSINAIHISVSQKNIPKLFRLSAVIPSARHITQGPKISVIMTAFNVAEYIEMAIESVLFQTWRNIELIVVDDVSSDSTVELVETMMKKDNRIRLIRNQINSGTYVGRNKAYEVSQGDFVTCHDSDDWAHPEKLERQIMALMSDSTKVASFSHMTRIMVEADLFQYRLAGTFANHNASSIMFNKNIVKSKIGYWDSVRIAADSEFIARLELAFGKEAIVTLPDILMFCAHRPMRLSADLALGFTGPRAEYRAAYKSWHESRSPGQCFVDFPLSERHFPVPDDILPTKISH